MFIVLLRFADKTAARETAKDHMAWIQRGLDDGAFLLVASLVPDAGGAIVAHGISPVELRDRVNADPFVKAGVVTAEIVELAPSRADPRLAFLVASPRLVTSARRTLPPPHASPRLVAKRVSRRSLSEVSCNVRG